MDHLFKIIPYLDFFMKETCLSSLNSKYFWRGILL